jgi:aspartyl-tRNA(Asn)/glutamyl-tRNA(Gln) amidotransferase subunit A
MSDATFGFGLVDLAAALRDGAITAERATEETLARLDGPGRRFNAVMSLRRDAALEQARAADRARTDGKTLGPLHGVPLAHKDLFYRKGEISTGGSLIRKDFRAETTATVLSRLDAAGAVDCGRLHLAEFALSPTGFNGHYGHGLNPWNPERCSGGSSSGSGAAVAAGLVTGALGTDTGGSIRHPAAMCGVVGLKPTWGRVPGEGVMPLSHSLDCVGPMARTARDAALLYDVIAGEGGRCLAALDGSVSGLSVAAVGGYYAEAVSSELATALAEARRVFRDLGIVLRETAVAGMDFANAGAHLVMTVEAATLHRRWLAERPQDYADQVRARIEPGLFYPATRYVEALALRGPTTEAFLKEAFGDADMALMPTIPAAAPTIAETTEGSPGDVAAKIAACTRFTRAVNYLGLPAIAVPCGFDPNGMPLSMQLIGRPHSEAMLLKVADAFQRVARHHEKRPPAA